MADGVSAEEFRTAMSAFASGVTIVTARAEDGAPHGLTATAFASVSRDPPLCLVCVAHAAEACPVIHATGAFAVNLLATGAEALSVRFATHGIDKFEGVPWIPGPLTRCPLLGGALMGVECTVDRALTAGDHDLFLGRLRAVHPGVGEPLLYFRARYGRFSP